MLGSQSEHGEPLSHAAGFVRYYGRSAARWFDDASVLLRDRGRSLLRHGVLLAGTAGAAGGIATPTSAAGACAMGAAYIVTGTINQACVESGSSDLVRKMLSEAQQADIAMAPAVDMFEMGVKLQVLKRGTLFAMRGNKLYEAYH